MHEPGPLGHRGEGRVVAHREGGFLGVGGHGLEHHGHLLLVDPEGGLAAGDVVLVGQLRQRRPDREAAQAVVGPPGVRRPPGQRPLDGGVGQEPPVSFKTAVGIDAEHLARAEPAPADLAVAGDRHRPHLGGADDEPVVADLVAQRPQPVAVERRAGPAAVGEDQSGGAVPRLGQAGVVAEEVAAPRPAGPGCPPTPRGRAWPGRGGRRARPGPGARRRSRACRSRSPRGRAAARTAPRGRGRPPRCRAGRGRPCGARCPASVLISPLWHR